MQKKTFLIILLHSITKGLSLAEGTAAKQTKKSPKI
jgi:hypothetical protein